MRFDTVIGLEVHAELSTKTKIFCSCSTEFGGVANTRTCPVCLGLPGTLPVLNKAVLEYCVKAGLALNSEISKFSKLDRKNYFYPDLPKAYQISQYDLPLCIGGHITLESGKKIRINRIHIEEDAGKLIHNEEGDGYSLVDYNRVGIPLIEIVSEPDISSSEEAIEYLEKLKGILEYLDVSDCKMQEGSLRCDANISLKEWGSITLGTKAELKNMNSFKALQRALSYEMLRQSELLEDGKKVIQETRRWDESKQKTLSMRSKEFAHDYRYFPDPDLIPIEMSSEHIEMIRHSLPELPLIKRERFISVYGLPEYDAGIITSSKYLASFFEKSNEYYYNPKSTSNFIMVELMRILKICDIEYKNNPVKPEYLGALLKLIDEDKISVTAGKKIFEIMFDTGNSSENIISDEGLLQISDEGELNKMIIDVLSKNSDSVSDYLSGKEKALDFLVGQIMKLSKGKANPRSLNKLIKNMIVKLHN